MRNKKIEQRSTINNNIFLINNNGLRLRKDILDPLDNLITSKSGIKMTWLSFK